MADESASAPPEQQDDAATPSTQETVTDPVMQADTEVTDAVADTKPTDSDAVAQEPAAESQITDAVTQPDTEPDSNGVAQEPTIDSQITNAVTQPDTEPQASPQSTCTDPATQAGTVSEDTKPTDTVTNDTKVADTAPQDNEEEAQTTGGDHGVADTAKEPDPISGKQLQMLLVGTEMIKVKKGNKTFSRIYSVSDDLLRIIWNSRRKPTNKAQISLSQIKRVLTGRQTESFALHTGELAEDRCFSIEYVEGGIVKTLDLVCLSSDTVELWTNGLRALTQQGVSQGTIDTRKKMLRVIFDEADDNKDGTLDLKEVLRLLRRLNIGISQKIIRQKFKQADTGGNSDNRLDFDEFVQLYTDLSDRPELRKIFKLYATSHEGSYMTVEDISKFVTEIQKMEDASREYCQSIIERFEPSSEGQNNLFLTLDGFVQYMLSKDNDIFKRSHTQIYQDMTQPLSHYFIASSHNTYLLEDQLSGPSSVEAYVNALKKGCRCVELDCWDGDDGDPVIYHGHTLTSKILFKDAIQGIKDNAFIVSSYPLILSIENHCGVEQQAKMAQYMIDIFGDLLHKETRDETLGKLPSPESLKNKILVKAKKLAMEHEEKSDDEGEVSDEDEAAEINPEEVEKAKAGGPSSVADRGGSPEFKSESGPPVRKIVYSNERQRTRSSTITKKPQKKLKLSSKLSRCVNYVQSVSFKGFEQAIAAPFYHMSSFGESSAFKHADQLAADYVEYNKIHLARTYPSGVRVDSSNYEPIDLWNCGCQIVALNYQTTGKPMDMVMGKFQQNGRSGYILKPEIMREDFSHFNHKNKEACTSVVPKLLTLRIISGQQLPKPEKGSKEGEVIDPYVLVQFFGVAQDKAEYRTKFVSDNGFNPVWNKTIQHVVTFPELCLIRFKVVDYDVLSQDDFIGQYTLPFDSMELGYRHIPIHTANWDRIENATLFVEVHIEEWFGPTPKSKDRVRQSMIKKSRQYPSSKQVHYQIIDRTIREGQNSVHNAIDIKEDYHFRTAIFKESCGKSSRSTIQECMEALFMSANVAKVEIKMVPHPLSGDKTIYQIETSGTVPSKALQDMINGFNELNSHISTLFNLGESLADELENSYSTLLGVKDEFISSLEQTQPKKAAQAKENYSHNLLVLRKEAKELRETITLATATIDKAIRCAQKFIVIPTTDTAQEPSGTNKEEMTTPPAESATPAATSD